MKLLVDTDIGSDIDDAWCLTYLLAQPACELLGITTVSGEVGARAELASALFDTYPDVPGKLKGLVMMAGAFRRLGGKGRWNEWNVQRDPEAATRVYGAEVPMHRSIGLNVTVRAQLSADEVLRRCQHERWRPALDMADVWFSQNEITTFHDPLAAASLFDGEILEWNRGAVTVGMIGDDRGSTTLSLAEDGPHEAASLVDTELFFRHFFSITG